MNRAGDYADFYDVSGWTAPRLASFKDLGKIGAKGNIVRILKISWP